ncbi:MAG: 16S rRNA (guanine(527)-N(7))-methyltransferase RsmG [Rhizobiales bacterium]|nr:16S rRNA (guanine(527)-N(7))-methyltransferase RsmG [Hyphomicrobiales bacterium]
MTISKQVKMHIKQLGLNEAQVAALNEYEQLLLKWQKSINLIASSTVTEIWMRHIIDSAQLFKMLDRSSRKSLLDLGSGGGFPALVIAILDKHADADSEYGTDKLKVTCIESVQKKSAFLKDVSRRLGLNIKVENTRIEQLAVQLYDEPSKGDEDASRETYGLNASGKFDFITARAVANLDKLLGYCEPYFARKTENNMVNVSTVFFLKGQDIDKELTEATKCWHIDYELTVSQTHQFGKIIKISDFGQIE